MDPKLWDSGLPKRRDDDFLHDADLLTRYVVSREVLESRL